VDGTELASGLGQGDFAGTVIPQPRGFPARQPPEPFIVKSVVGRLVELQVFELALPEDVAVLNAALLAAVSSFATSVVLLADHRRARPFPHEVGDAWSRGMRMANPRVIRSGILLDPANETFNLQMARVVRCAGSPRRRWFDVPSDLRAWLADVATPCELARVDELLG
jgi:hypothetical protein